MHATSIRIDAPIAVAPRPRTSTTPHLGAIFAIIAVALAMSSLDQTIVATALDTLQGDLHTTLSWAGWTITVYALGLTLMLPVSGRLSERFGRRRVFVASVAVFSVASLCCGFAGNIYALVALRFIQALGGAGFTPSATGIIVERFGSSRDRAVGLFGSVFAIGAMVGPIFGGLFVTYWSWRGIFFVNVPIGLALVALALRWIPADGPRSPATEKHFDLVGMLTLGTGVLAGMFAFTALGRGGDALVSPEFLGAAAITVIALGLFARHTAASAHPFIAARFLVGRGFAATNAVNVVYGGVVTGLVALVPVYATARYGIPALAAGALLTCEGIAFILMSVAGAMLLRRTGYRRPIFGAALVITLGVAGLAWTPSGVDPYLWLTLSAGVIGAGAGWLSPATRNAGLQLAPDSSPTLAALRSMCFEVGTIATIAVTTAVLSLARDAGAMHAVVYLAWAACLLLALVLVPRVPEHRGTW